MATIQFRREDKSLMNSYFDQWRKSLPRNPNQFGGTISSITESEGDIIQIDDEVQPYSDFYPIRWSGVDQRFVDYLNNGPRIWHQIVES